MNSIFKKLKTTTKHKIAALTLACGMTPGLVAQQNQITESEPADSIKTASVTDNPRKTDSNLSISWHNMLGAQTTGKEVKFLDRATITAKAEFTSQKKWYGNAQLGGTIILRNNNISANITQATFELGKQISEKSTMSIKLGREYTEKTLVYGNKHLVDFTVADIYCDYFGNLTDKVCLVYNRDNFNLEAGLIEKADSTFYLVPNAIKNPNFWGKVSFIGKKSNDLYINYSMATELGIEAKNVFINLDISNKKFGILLGGNVDINNKMWGLCVSANYITQKDVNCILSMVKHYQTYIVQAAIEKRNVMLFASMNTYTKTKPTFNVGLSWVLDGQKKIR